MRRSWGEGWRPLVCVYKVSSTCGSVSTHGGIWGVLSVCGISGWGDTYGENLLLFLGHVDGGMCEYSMCVMTVFECMCCMLEHVLYVLTCLSAWGLGKLVCGCTDEQAGMGWELQSNALGSLAAQSARQCLKFKIHQEIVDACWGIEIRKKDQHLNVEPLIQPGEWNWEGVWHFSP